MSDFSIIVVLVVTMVTLFFGFESLGTSEYLKLLSSSKSRWKVFSLVMFSRFILLAASFIISFGLVIIMFHIRGIILSPGDYTALGKYLLQTLAMLSGFFFIGGIVGTLESKKLAYPLLFASWFFMIFLLTGLVHSLDKPNKPDITQHFQTLLKKFETVIDFESYTKEKYGEFDKNNIELERKIIEDYLSTYFKEIVALEKALRNKIETYINSYRRAAVFTPVSFYISTCSEVSSRGYENYTAFYDYLIKMRIAFFRFWVDRVYYNDPKVMVSFIRSNEDIYRGKALVPVNYWTGVSMDLLYALVFYVLNYMAFKIKLVYMSCKDLAFPKEVYIELDKGDLKVWKIKGGRLNRLLYRVFSGYIRDLKAKGFKGEILVDEIDLTLKKNKTPYLYVCMPEQLPGDIKVKDLLNFYSRWSSWHCQPLEKKTRLLNSPGIQPLMNKYIGKLEDYEKYE